MTNHIKLMRRESSDPYNDGITASSGNTPNTNCAHAQVRLYYADHSYPDVTALPGRTHLLCMCRREILFQAHKYMLHSSAKSAKRHQSQGQDHAHPNMTTDDASLTRCQGIQLDVFVLLFKKSVMNRLQHVSPGGPLTFYF